MGVREMRGGVVGTRRRGVLLLRLDRREDRADPGESPSPRPDAATGEPNAKLRRGRAPREGMVTSPPIRDRGAEHRAGAERHIALDHTEFVRLLWEDSVGAGSQPIPSSSGHTSPGVPTIEGSGGVTTASSLPS